MVTANPTSREDIRVSIGRQVKALRTARAWSQSDLATRLEVSQSRLSHMERGAASLSAEEFLDVLRIFNVPATHFADDLLIDHRTELQNALARLGATHLSVSDAVRPSDRLFAPEHAVLETLTTSDPRLIAAVGPVIATHPDCNIAWVLVQARTIGRVQRFSWIL